MKSNYNFNVKKKRPEEKYTNVSDYFKGEMLKQYATSKSIIKTQEKITIRALELLDLRKEKGLILDAGAGPGFSAMYLNEIGYKTIAIDIIPAFLSYYDISELNPVVSDMCFPPFKPNTFDAIVSISALQWIFKNNNDQNMKELLKSLSLSFYHILKPQSKVIFQFYPKNDALIESIGKIITKNTNFKGNFVIDNPNSPKKRKIYLLLIKDK
ncbi:MAG: class I SAM-dependent methyltransferase [Candidatus Thorarchaeota archaeon]